MKILYVAKDFAAAKYLYHLISASKQAGQEYCVLADPKGKGLPFLKEKGVDIVEQTEVKNFDVIVSGCSTPAGIEQEIINEASSLQKKIILFPDNWCRATKRISCNPDLILCIDKINVEINSGQKTLVVGDPVGIERTSKKDDYWLDETIFVALQNKEVSRTIVDVLKKFKELHNYSVFPRIHPKYENELWAYELNEEIYDFCPNVFLEKEIPTGALEEKCEITISTFSGALKVSSFNGKKAVSAMSPEARKTMINETGIDYYPLTELGFATEINAGESWGIENLIKEKKYQPQKFNKEKFVKAITSL